MKTESYEQYWQRRLEDTEKAREVALKNLQRIALQSQLQLFSYEAEIIYLPSRQEIEAA